MPVYLFLGGLTAGMIISTTLLSWRFPMRRSRWVRWLPFVAPVLLSVGMFALFLDLEYKLHVFRFYTTFQWTSPMSWGSWILILIYPAVLLTGLTSLTEKEVERLTSLMRWPLSQRFKDSVGRLRDFATRHNPALEWGRQLHPRVAPVLLLARGLALRWIFVSAGQVGL